MTNIFALNQGPGAHLSGSDLYGAKQAKHESVKSPARGPTNVKTANSGEYIVVDYGVLTTDAATELTFSVEGRELFKTFIPAGQPITVPPVALEPNESLHVRRIPDACIAGFIITRNLA